MYWFLINKLLLNIINPLLKTNNYTTKILTFNFKLLKLKFQFI